MSDDTQLVSKVLVLDGNESYFDRIKIFCDNNNLVGVRALEANVLAVLKSNVDLGAILLSEDYGGKAHGGVALARQINRARPELPIFLRREQAANLDGLSEKDRKIFCVAYTIDSIADLRKVLDEYIFSLVYPNVMVRGIKEITQSALEGLFKDANIETEAPYIVRDRIIYGEVFSLIPLESNWCRGYMMLQSGGADILRIAQSGTQQAKLTSADFRSINHVLGEATNLIWGAFKNRYFSDDDRSGIFKTQVPIIINHQHRYISFGSENPQLCFKYTLSDKQDSTKNPAIIFQRFVFNLNWSPEDFKEVQASLEELVDSGELELF